ncbi:MAG: LysM peptidoglycan-binding domain-containing protein [Chloroflexaceae bacterium]|nr:LysM peptidoglycan-binding domain-containing protein [Chloroflexaceae bacterium]
MHAILDEGTEATLPGPAGLLLHYHLATCPQCRIYEVHSRHRELLARLLAEVPGSGNNYRDNALLAALLTQHVPVSRPQTCGANVGQQARPAARRLAAGSAALLIGGALALGSGNVATVAAQASTAPAAAPVAAAVMNPASQQDDFYSGFNRYTVQRGDTLESIAVKQFGNGAAWRDLYRLNEAIIGSNPNFLRVGLVLRMPPFGRVEPPTPAPGGSEYVVRAGDTLSVIAQRVYGDASMWNAIYEANRVTIGANPARIITGQRLVIPTSPGRPPIGGPLYTVQSGDTLSGLALRFYGQASRWRLLYDANRDVIGGNPGLLRVGTTLLVPPLDAQPTPPTGQSYTVQRGDTLSGLSQRFYGDANLWRVIYNANRSVIGNNANQIAPGQVLSIPRI